MASHTHGRLTNHQSSSNLTSWFLGHANEQGRGCGGEASSRPDFDGENWAPCTMTRKGHKITRNARFLNKMAQVQPRILALRVSGVAIGAELRTRSLILDGTLQHTRITHISGRNFVSSEANQS